MHLGSPVSVSSARPVAAGATLVVWSDDLVSAQLTPRPATVYVRRRDVLWRGAPGFLALADVAGTSVTVGGPGVRVWELLATPHSMDGLVHALGSEFCAEEDMIRRDVEPLLTDLLLRGFIDAQS